jgi:hypothetical protein
MEQFRQGCSAYGPPPFQCFLLHVFRGSWIDPWRAPDPELFRGYHPVEQMAKFVVFLFWYGFVFASGNDRTFGNNYIYIVCFLHFWFRWGKLILLLAHPPPPHFLEQTAGPGTASS